MKKYVAIGIALSLLLSTAPVFAKRQWNQAATTPVTATWVTTS